MTNSLTLSWLVIALFVSAAIVLGFSVSLFAGKRSSKNTNSATDFNDIIEEEKEQYDSDIYERDQEIISLKEQISLSEENIDRLSRKTEELRWQYKMFEGMKSQLEQKLAELSRKKSAPHIIMPENKNLRIAQ